MLATVMAQGWYDANARMRLRLKDLVSVNNLVELFVYACTVSVCIVLPDFCRRSVALRFLEIAADGLGTAQIQNIAPFSVLNYSSSVLNRIGCVSASLLVARLQPFS